MCDVLDKVENRGIAKGKIEGTVSNVPPQGGRKHPQQEYLQIDTKNILFICGGAFDGLEKIFKAFKKVGAL